MKGAKIEKQNEKIDSLFEELKKKVKERCSTLEEPVDSYEFEKTLHAELSVFSHDLYQAICGEERVPKNDRMKLLTSFGEIQLRKNHPLAVSPSGFKISAYLQSHMCRLGSRLVFSEASEELERLVHLPCNAKQIERLCHHYGSCMDSTYVSHLGGHEEFLGVGDIAERY